VDFGIFNNEGVIGKKVQVLFKKKNDDDGVGNKQNLGHN